MAQVILGADVEALVRTYLLTELNARPAYTGTVVATRVPEDRETLPRFVTVIAIGGAGRSNVIFDEVNVTIDAWALDSPAAHALAQLCRGLLHNISTVGGVQFYTVTDFSAPANLPDPTTGQARYRATYAIRVRGVAE